MPAGSNNFSVCYTSRNLRLRALARNVAAPALTNGSFPPLLSEDPDAAVSVTNGQSLSEEYGRLISYLRSDIDMETQLKRIHGHRKLQVLRRNDQDFQRTNATKAHHSIFLKMLLGEAVRYHVTEFQRRNGIARITRRQMMRVINTTYVRYVASDIDVLMGTQHASSDDETPPATQPSEPVESEDKYCFVLDLLAKESMFASFSRIKFASM